MRRAAMILATASLTGCGQAAGHAAQPTGDAGGPVAWTNVPAPRYIPPPQPSPESYLTSAPPCRSDDVRVAPGRGGDAAGNWLDVVVFRNVGPAPCLLRGYPTVSGVGPDGARVTLHPGRGETYFGGLVPADMRPGGRTLLYFATGAGCSDPTATRYRNLVFDVPRLGSIAGGRASITEACGILEMTQLGRPPRRVPEVRSRPGTFGALRARLELPARVRAGSTLRYVVTLRNPTDTRVGLDPCPTYTEMLALRDRVLRPAFVLNCDRVHAIGAHHRVRYAMRLLVPAGAPAGIAKVGWSGNTPTGPWAGGVVEVVPESD